MTKKSISRRYVYCIQPRRQRFHGREEEAPDYRRVRHDGERCRVRRGGKDEVRALEKNFLINVASPPLSTFPLSLVQGCRTIRSEAFGRITRPASPSRGDGTSTKRRRYSRACTWWVIKRIKLKKRV